MIILIAAMDEDRVIGFENKMPWQIPSELAHFRQTTAGHTVLMGRKTFESIGRTLPKRHNIIITSKPLDVVSPSVTVTSDLLGTLKEWESKKEPLFVIGGPQIYEASLAHADQIILSIIPGKHQGDTFFPKIPDHLFSIVNTIQYPEFKVVYYQRNQ